MPIKSRWSLEIPNQSVPTWLFGSPDKPLPETKSLIDADRPNTHYLTLSGYRLWAKRFAVGLQKAGLQTGDRVLIFSGNNLFYPVAWMGIVMAGGIATGANPTYVSREVAYQLKDTDAKFLLVADGSLDVGLEAASMAGISKNRVFLFDAEILDGTGKSRLEVQNWSTLVGSVEEGEGFQWLDPKSPKDTTCCLNYSSGTTGVPKGVEITHLNFVSNSEQVIFASKLHPDYDYRTKTSRWLCFLPLYHAYGQTYFLLNGPKRGIPIFIMPKFDFVQMLELVQREKITQLTLVPPIAIAIAKHPLSKKYNLSSVRTVGSGAAPLSRAVSIEIEEILANGSNLKQGWGMTEATCSVMGWDPMHISKSASVGELNANCEAKVMNSDCTAEVPRGERGELWVKGPNVMKGYWRKPKATEETLTPDGWLRTGDVCYIDEDSRFHIVDRIKELIKVKGLQVAPAELEALLLEHPEVADSAVVGVTINGDESPRAYVVLKEGSKISGEELVKWVEPKVSRHKRLSGGVIMIEAIPKNPSGKILRKILRERADAEVGDVGKKRAKI